MKRLEHPDRWLQGFAHCASNLSRFSRKNGLFDVQFTNDFVNFAGATFREISGDQREETIREIFERPTNFYPASLILRRQLGLSARSQSNGDPQPDLTSTEIERIVAAQLSILASLEPTEWRKSPDPWEVLWTWHQTSDSPKPAANFLSRTMLSDEDFLATLEALRRVTSSAQNDVPHIPVDWLSKFLDPDPIKVRLQGLSKRSTEMASRAKILLGLWWLGGFSVEEDEPG